MKTENKWMFSAELAATLLSLSAVSGMSRPDANTVIGAGAGAVGGAVVGSVIGQEVSKPAK